jgi:hypothetical protein
MCAQSPKIALGSDCERGVAGGQLAARVGKCLLNKVRRNIPNLLRQRAPRGLGAADQDCRTIPQCSPSRLDQALQTRITIDRIDRLDERVVGTGRHSNLVCCEGVQRQLFGLGDAFELVGDNLIDIAVPPDLGRKEFVDGFSAYLLGIMLQLRLICCEPGQPGALMLRA